MNNKNTLIALRRARQKGYGLIEIAMGLAIAALLVAGAMMYFSNASTAQATNDAMSEMGALQQVTRSLYSGQPNYNGLTDTLIAGSKQIPAKYVNVAGTGLTSSFRGPVTVASFNTDQNFQITLTNVPQQACNKMATTDLGTGMVDLTINGGTAVAARAMTPAEANANCSSNANSIVWTFF